LLLTKLEKNKEYQKKYNNYQKLIKGRIMKCNNYCRRGGAKVKNMNCNPELIAIRYWCRKIKEEIFIKFQINQ